MMVSYRARLGMVEGTMTGAIQDHIGSGRIHYDGCQTGPHWVW